MRWDPSELELHRPDCEIIHGWLCCTSVEGSEHECSQATCAPSKHTPQSHGTKVQFATVDTSLPLDKTKTNFIQRAIGKPLHCAQAVDPTMSHAVNDTSGSAAKGTEATPEATVHLPDHAHTHPDAVTTHTASDMTLRVDGDAACLEAPEARSGAGGCHHLGNQDGTTFNGPMLVLAKVISGSGQTGSTVHECTTGCCTEELPW